MEKIPDIKPIKLKEYNVKQSKYTMVGRIPIRQIALGPSGAGKGIYIYIYIYIFKTKYWIFTKNYLRGFIYFHHFHQALKLIVKHGNLSRII